MSAKLLNRKKRGDDDEMDITPMIDITFLLLIFFLVASKMDEAATLKLPPARHGQVVGSRNCVVLSMLAGVGEAEAKVFKGDRLDTGAQFKGDQAQQEENIAAWVEDQIGSSTELMYVLIKAEKDVRHEDVSRVAKAVGQAESVQNLYVAVLENT